jgi:hypothetical protein
MIKGKVKIELTAENILKMITPFDIFRHFMPNINWRINEATNSPLHPDQNPSFLIGNKNGHLTFIDFSLSLSGDAFDFIKALHACSYNEALRIIDKEFGLGISDVSNVGEYKRIVSEYKQPEEDKEKHSVMIQVVTRKFTNEELSYWNSYHIDLQDLRDNHIYSIDKLFLNRKRFPLKETELRFGYLYQGRYWKLYRPHNSKKTKWLSNVPLSLAGGLENLDKNHNTLIAKSLKDQVVCRKIYSYVCHVQNESLAAFSQETVDYINNNSILVFYGGDSDPVGKSASYIITDTFKWKHINPPDQLLTECCKDFASWGAKSMKEVEEHFKKKGLF